MGFDGAGDLWHVHPFLLAVASASALTVEFGRVVPELEPHLQAAELDDEVNERTKPFLVWNSFERVELLPEPL